MVQSGQLGAHSPFAHKKALVPNAAVEYAKKLVKKGQLDAAITAVNGIIRTKRDWEVTIHFF